MKKLIILPILLFAVFLSTEAQSNRERNLSQFEKYILEFQEAQKYINMTLFEKYILEFQKGQKYINS